MWLKGKNSSYLFLVVFFPSTTFYFLPLVQWHQALLWCCHKQTLPRLVTCCSQTQILLFICFNYFCQVRTRLRGRRSCTVVTYQQKEWWESNAGTLLLPWVSGTDGITRFCLMEDNPTSNCDGVGDVERRYKTSPPLLLQHGSEELLVKKDLYPVAL